MRCCVRLNLQFYCHLHTDLLLLPNPQARSAQEDFDHFDFDSIDDAFGMINGVKFSQSIRLPKSECLGPAWRGATRCVLRKHAIPATDNNRPDLTALSAPVHLAGNGITVSAYIAGHMLGMSLTSSAARHSHVCQPKIPSSPNLPLPPSPTGGSVWRITKNDESIVYAVDFNAYNEVHLRRTTVETLSRPFLFITDSYTAQRRHVKSSERATNTMNDIVSTLRKDGNVLLLSDTAGRYDTV